MSSCDVKLHEGASFMQKQITPLVQGVCFGPISIVILSYLINIEEAEQHRSCSTSISGSCCGFPHVGVWRHLCIRLGLHRRCDVRGARLDVLPPVVFIQRHIKLRFIQPAQAHEYVHLAVCAGYLVVTALPYIWVW